MSTKRISIVGYSLIIVLISASVFVLYDLLFSKPTEQKGVIVEKIYVPAHNATGYTPYGGARRGNYFITSQQVEQWIAIIKTDTGDLVPVHCKIKHYNERNIGDTLIYKKYEGEHLHIKYFAHYEEE